MSQTEWSDLAVSGLPTGTVTLLLADVEGSTRLWESQPVEMTAAIARLDATLADLITVHRGVRPVEQGEGDSFVLAFARASDAVACALELQRAPLAPIRLRIGVHTGEVQLRDEGNYIGPTINRAARLRDLAHGGQVVLSGATEELVFDRLPDSAWLTDLGRHSMRDVPRPERVVQLCHPDVRGEFPPLRTPDTIVTHNLPAQLTSFVGRGEQMSRLGQLLAENRLVTLTGTGGAGKTRLAIQVAAGLAVEFADGVWYVDLAPITDSGLVPVAVARALGLPDQLGRSTIDTLVRFISDHHMMVVLDNCEHLLDASAALLVALLGACPAMKLLATSREPIGVSGEAIWRVPSLSLADEAVALFTDRARLARSEFSFTVDNAATVTEICRRLDGMPLAIELAAARVRTLSLDEILVSLRDQFRLLTGGARTAVRRQQTLRASVDWSHALMTESERVLFHRLAAFVGGFDLDAAQAVTATTDIERYQVLEQLTLLVDKSMVVAENITGRTRYRLLETVRQYALEKLSESGEADFVRGRHRDYYTALAAELDAPARSGNDRRLEQIAVEIDNLRAAGSWSRENGEVELALQLASSLQPLWLARARIKEGLTWFDAVETGETTSGGTVAPMVRARALADQALLNAWAGDTNTLEQAEQAVAIALEIDDSALLARAMSARSCITFWIPGVARLGFEAPIDLARGLADQWRLSQLFGWQALAEYIAGDPIAGRAAGEEGRAIADAIDDRFHSRQCRVWLGWALMMAGDLAGAAAELRGVIAEAELAHDSLFCVIGGISLGHLLAYQGDTSTACTAAQDVREAAAEIGWLYEGSCNVLLAAAALAAGDIPTAKAAGELWRFCCSGGGGIHVEMIAHLLDRMATDGETINWWERVTPRQRD